jgi:hypothetical protein
VEKIYAKVSSSTNVDFSSVCDIVRGAIVTKSIAHISIILQQIQNHVDIKLVRIKNRLHSPNENGWSDCMVNFYFVNEQSKHVCEIQLIHHKFMVVRTSMGAHSFYSDSRSAIELLEHDLRWTEECILVKLFIETNGVAWTHKEGWCTAEIVSNWYGVQTNANGQIIGLRLNRNRLQGQFPQFLHKLKYLQYLDLEGNNLIGKNAQCVL